MNPKRFGLDDYDVQERGFETACWIFQKKPTTGGYCQMKMPDGSQPGAHRVFYEHHIGPIPAGLTVDHLCKVRNCVNPAHLEIVTRAENTLRGESPHALNARKDRCMHGHPYDAENTYVSPRGWRACRACHKRWRQERKAAA